MSFGVWSLNSDQSADQIAQRAALMGAASQKSGQGILIDRSCDADARLPVSKYLCWTGDSVNNRQQQMPLHKQRLCLRWRLARGVKTI